MWIKQIKIPIILIVLFLMPNFAWAAYPAPIDVPEPVKDGIAQELDIHFFYSETCPHCIKEQGFLDDLERKYPQVNVYRHNILDKQTIKLMSEMTTAYKVENYFGLTPLTFIGDVFVPGFDADHTTGQYIELAVIQQLGLNESSNNLKVSNKNEDTLTLPLVGEINPGKYSLPVLAIILGLIDGINVCSLGALILILSMILVLKSRKKMLLFGGIFLITTAVIYGILIVLWYKIFSWLAPYIGFLEILIGLLGIAGSIYFFRQFYKYKKYGPTCEISTGKKMSGKFSNLLSAKIEGGAGILVLTWIIFLFALVITVIEFPCSAVVPVAFAGVLAKAGLPALGYIFYIALFIFFYLLDELIIFLIATFKMSIWLTSNKFTTWATFAAAVVLLLLGLFYLFGI